MTILFVKTQTVLLLIQKSFCSWNSFRLIYFLHANSVTLAETCELNKRMVLALLNSRWNGDFKRGMQLLKYTCRLLKAHPRKGNFIFKKIASTFYFPNLLMNRVQEIYWCKAPQIKNMRNYYGWKVKIKLFQQDSHLITT